MAYDVRFLPAALREFRKLPRKVQVVFSARINALGDHPRPAGAKKLQSSGGLWRIREGDYRPIYRIRESELLVLVVRTGHRREFYRRLAELVKSPSK